MNDNIGGDELAQWLVSDLRGRGYDASDAWAEDHGWDFFVYANDSRYLVVCARDFDDEDKNPGFHWVVVGKLRRLKDYLRFRGRIRPDDSIIEAIARALKANSAIEKVDYQFEG